MNDQQPDGDNCYNGSVVHEPEPHHKEAFPVLVLGALGVVYGDIGTSPIYAFREALHAASLDGSLSRTSSIFCLYSGLTMMAKAVSCR
jgi:KUP system potassium uptake protein